MTDFAISLLLLTVVFALGLAALHFGRRILRAGKDYEDGYQAGHRNGWNEGWIKGRRFAGRQVTRSPSGQPAEEREAAPKSPPTRLPDVRAKLPSQERF